MAAILVTDLDSFFAAEQAAQDFARSQITADQASAKPGDFTVSTSSGIAIYSEILPSMEEDEDGNEFEVEAGDYVFTRSFSAWCPKGELGDKHRTDLSRKITREEFEAFRLRGWPQSL